MFNFHKILLIIVFQVAVISVLGISSCTKSQQLNIENSDLPKKKSYKNPIFIGCEISYFSEQKLKCFILEDGTGIAWKPEDERIYISNFQLTKNELSQISDVFRDNDFFSLPRSIYTNVYDAFEDTLCYVTQEEDHYVKKYGTRNTRFENISDFLKQMLEKRLRSDRHTWEMTSNLEFEDYIGKLKSFKMIKEKLNDSRFARAESVNYLYHNIIVNDLKYLKRGYKNFKILYSNLEFVGYKNNITNVRGFITEDARGFVLKNQGDQVKFAEFKLSQQEMFTISELFRKKQFFNLSFFNEIASCDKSMVCYKTKTDDLNFCEPSKAKKTPRVPFADEVNIDTPLGEPIDPKKKFEIIFTFLTQIFEEKLDAGKQSWKSKSNIHFKEYIGKCTTIINLKQNDNFFDETTPHFFDCFLHH